MNTPTVATLDERAIVAALERARGRVSVAARALGVTREALRKALESYLRHLRVAVPLRGRGAPPTVEVPRAEFLFAWEASGRRLHVCARELKIDRDVARRLAREYQAPGAPPQRKR